MNKLRAYELQDGGMDTVEANETLGFAADARDYEFSAQILKKLGATKIRLLSNNPEKVRQLESSGIRVAQGACRASRAFQKFPAPTSRRKNANGASAGRNLNSDGLRLTAADKIARSR